MTAPYDDERPPSRAPIPRLIGAGARGVRAVAGATGIEEAAERSAEDAIIRALENPAVIRAIGRALETDGAAEALELTITSPALARALSSPEVTDAIIAALDSETTDRVWDHLLASDEVQKLVERIAEAPEVRAAITSQGAGLVWDMGRTIREIADHFDDAIDSLVARFRGRRKRPPGPQRVGLVTRAVAAAADGAILNLLFLGVSAILGVTIGGVIGDDEAPSGLAIVAGSALWIGAGAIYLGIFWALAGQTPGMRFLSIRLEAGGKRAIGVRRAVRRLVGIGLSVLTLGVGFLLVVTDPRRRSLADRIAGTEVIEDDRRLVAPHSVRPAAPPE